MKILRAFAFNPLHNEKSAYFFGYQCVGFGL